MREVLRQLFNQRFVVLPQRIIHGADVVRDFRFLRTSQYWSAEQLAAYQLRKLQQLIAHAYTNSPFYRKRFNKIGLEPGDIRKLSDIRGIPCLTKTDLRERLDEIKVHNVDDYAPILTRTGGTTGAPVSLYRSRNTASFRKAIEWRTFAWGEQDHRQKKMSLFPGTSKDIGKEVWFEDPRNRMLIVKTFQLDSERLDLFCKLFHRYRPSFLMGIVEFYRVLGRYLEKHGINDIRVPALFVQGESVTAEDRRNFCRWFGTKVFDYYGMRENAVSASECVEGTMHINQEFVLHEFEDNGDPAKIDEPAEIIGTSLHNYATPLIRYRTGDIGQHESTSCPCGRVHTAMRIIGGRTRDFITTPTRMIYVCQHTSYLLDLSSGVEAIQFYQADVRSLEVRIVRNERYRSDDAQKLVKAVRRLVEDELRVTVRFVEDIPRTRVGKYRFVVSEVDSSL